MINDRNEARYRSLFENSCDAILLSGSDGTILSANPAACHMLGMSEEEIVRSGIEGITVKDEKFELAVREQHHITKAEITYRRKDGTTFVGERTYSPFIDADGSTKTSIIVRDITDRLRLEKAVKESEELFHTMANNISQLAWMADADGSRFWFNKRWLDYTGIVA